jgi:hypothetical protein
MHALEGCRAEGAAVADVGVAILNDGFVLRFVGALALSALAACSIGAIRAFIDAYHERCRPLPRTKTAEQIHAKDPPTKT